MQIQAGLLILSFKCDIYGRVFSRPCNTSLWTMYLTGGMESEACTSMYKVVALGAGLILDKKLRYLLNNEDFPNRNRASSNFIYMKQIYHPKNNINGSQ